MVISQHNRSLGKWEYHNSDRLVYQPSITVEINAVYRIGVQDPVAHASKPSTMRITLQDKVHLLLAKEI